MRAGGLAAQLNAPTAARLLVELDLRVLLFNAGYELAQAWRRRTRRLPPPTALYLETSSFCRGHCHGCYVPPADRSRHISLSEGALRRLLLAAERLHFDYVCIVGGEPLDESVIETNLRAVHDHPRLRFLMCTSGTADLCGESLRELRRLRNLSLVVSFDGDAEAHDRIRGFGSHDRSRELVRRYNGDGRRLCGASVTLRPDNWEVATSDDLLSSFSALGCNFLAFDACFGMQAVSALAPAEFAEAVRRLMAFSASAAAQVFVHPFGQLLGSRITPARRMSTLAVDYRGDVYLSRRGPSLGNVASDPLESLLAAADEPVAAQPTEVESHHAHDPREALFRDTLSALA